MKIHLPLAPVPAQIMLHVWQQVRSQPTPRTVDKHVATDPGLLEHWQQTLSVTDQADAETLMKVLHYQAHSNSEMELTESEADQAMRACARCRLYLQSPWLDLQLPSIKRNDCNVTDAELIEALLCWFGVLEEALILVQHEGWEEI
jgi:hypothetical protein